MVSLIIEVLRQFGPFVGLVAFIAVMYWVMLRWFKDFVKQMNEQALKREAEQRDIIKEQIKEIGVQRRQRHKDHGKISQSLDEVVKAIGRINGYKH